MKCADHFRLADPEQRTLGHSGSSRESNRVRRDHAVLPQEFPGTHQGNRRFFSVRGDDSYSELAPLHVKNRVGGIALGVGYLILLKTKTFFAQPSSGEKGLSIEDRIAIFLVAAWALEAGKALQFRLWGIWRIVQARPMDPVWLVGLGCGLECPWCSFHTSSGAAVTLPYYTPLQETEICTYCSILYRLRVVNFGRLDRKSTRL